MSVAQAETERRKTILTKLAANPLLCHKVLFDQRHADAMAPFHPEIIERWWSSKQYDGAEAFRGGAKSTLSEEAVTAQALIERFHYGIFVGSTYSLACQRLGKVKHEIRMNEPINELFGVQEGETWNEGEIVLKNGVKVQAVGAGQSLRGLKYLDYRPDFVVLDDLEDYGERVPDYEKDIAPMMDWLVGGLLPACDPRGRTRILGTPLHPRSVLEQLRQQWGFRAFPIVTPAVADPEQWERSNWEARFPLDAVRKIRDTMAATGHLQKFVQEFLCVSEEAALKPFKQSHIIKAPHIPEWAPSTLIIDPARTTNQTTSARTGYAVVSWVGSKCYVRMAYGAFHTPSQIVDETFKLDRIFNFMWVKPEKDGLAEFLLQPYRTRMIETGHVLPLSPLQAPRDRDKNSFITGLQPFFEAGDILFCDDAPDLVAELMAFPSGRKDVLNALAYAPRCRPGMPIYPDFAFHHVAPASLACSQVHPAYLCLSARGAHVTAALMQYLNGSVRIFADWVREGAPSDVLEALLGEATLAAGKRPLLLAPAKQFDKYMNFGLPGAIQRLNLTAQHGPEKIGALEPHLRKMAQHQPAFLVNRDARWTVNALAGGYARSLDKSGVLLGDPDEGYYRTLMEGIEAFVGWLTVETAMGDTGPVNWQHTPDGRRYISARATGAPPPSELKIQGVGGIRIVR